MLARLREHADMDLQLKASTELPSAQETTASSCWTVMEQKSATSSFNIQPSGSGREECRNSQDRLEPQRFFDAGPATEDVLAVGRGEELDHHVVVLLGFRFRVRGLGLG